MEYTAHICLDRPSRAGTSVRVPVGAEVLKPALEDTPRLLTLLGLHRMHDAAVKGAGRPLDLGQVQGLIALQRLYIRNPAYDFQENATYEHCSLTRLRLSMCRPRLGTQSMTH